MAHYGDKVTNEEYLYLLNSDMSKNKCSEIHIMLNGPMGLYDSEIKLFKTDGDAFFIPLSDIESFLIE